jgi:hypothetical protein
MNIDTILIDPKRIINRKANFPEKPEDCTGIKPTSVYGVDKGDFVIISKETWKRIEIFMSILSGAELSISEDQLKAVLGGGN